jgi:hypothetical protein
MNQSKKNAEDAKMLSLDLQQGVEIEQKIEHYKTILKAYGELVNAIDGKIEKLSLSIGDNPPAIVNADVNYEISKLTIEKLDAENTILDKKKFFEMWLKRSAEYEKKFATITKECEENFEQVESEAKEIAKGNIKLQSYMGKYEAEENKTQKLKNEYYLLLKYEVTKISGKGKFEMAK